MGLLDRILGEDNKISSQTKSDLYDRVDDEVGVQYSDKRAIRVSNKVSEYVNFDDQGSVSLDSGPLMDGPHQRALKEAFGNMLYGDDRKNRTTPKMIGDDDTEYEEIGAATIGVGMAAAKVDEVGHTPYSPAYGELFAKVVEDNQFNQNPDVASNPEKEAADYRETVQETAEAIEGQLLELRPEPEFDEIDEQLSNNSKDPEREKEIE